MNLPPITAYTSELRFALESVSSAAALVKKVRVGMVEAAFTKNDASPVTVADFAAQALVAKEMLKVFPKDVFVGEESAKDLRSPQAQGVLQTISEFLEPFIGKTSPSNICDWIDHGSQEPQERFWTMDPIDGTKGFIRGDQYAVALALLENGKVQVAVLACPNLEKAHKVVLGGEGTLVCAVRGQGSWQTPLIRPGIWEKMKVSDHCEGASAVLLRSFETQHTDSPRMKRFMELLGIQKPPILMDSLAKYVVLASGSADLLLRFPTQEHPYEWIWDQAAGVLLIEEAGGKVTDLQGKALDFKAGRQLKQNKGVVLSNQYLHAPVLKAIQQLSDK